MKPIRYVLFLLMFCLVCACSNTTIKAEPSAPDPFPVGLSTRLSVFDVNVQEESTSLKLLMTVNRNYEYHDNVKLEYSMWKTSDNMQEELGIKNVFDGKVELYVKKDFSDEIRFSSFGQYTIKIESSYRSYGLSVLYLLDFDENGVSIVQQ